MGIYSTKTFQNNRMTGSDAFLRYLTLEILNKLNVLKKKTMMKYFLSKSTFTFKFLYLLLLFLLFQFS